MPDGDPEIAPSSDLGLRSSLLGKGGLRSGVISQAQGENSTDHRTIRVRLEGVTEMCNHCCCLLDPMSKALASPSNRLIQTTSRAGFIGYNLAIRHDGTTDRNLFVLKINPKRERHNSSIARTRFELPDSDLAKPSGKLYIGSSYASHLLCFDLVSDLLVDLGPIHDGQTTFPCRIDEDRQGRLWIGSYGTANLTCYDRQQKVLHTRDRWTM